VVRRGLPQELPAGGCSHCDEKSDTSSKREFSEEEASRSVDCAGADARARRAW
jgi:hypothetical protein